MDRAAQPSIQHCLTFEADNTLDLAHLATLFTIATPCIVPSCRLSWRAPTNLSDGKPGARKSGSSLAQRSSSVAGLAGRQRAAQRSAS